YVVQRLIGRTEACMRVAPESIEQLHRPQIDTASDVAPVTTGVAASPGAAVGRVAFDADRAVEMAADGNGPVILVRPETTPDDIHGMAAAAGILTAQGGKTSHAAVVARGMGKPAVTGASGPGSHHSAQRALGGEHDMRAGDMI